MRLLVLVSGPIAVGKSAFIKVLEERFRARRISTREIILELKKVESERTALQKAGESLDLETDGKWLADALRSRSFDKDDIVILDSVRIAKQIAHLRDEFKDKIWHVHVTASKKILKERFEARKSDAQKSVNDSLTYEEASSNSTEANIASLRTIADTCVDTDRLDPGSVAARAISGRLLFPVRLDKLVDVIVGGQFGSEGKGNICDFLARDYDVLVRVGGPNAGHKVADPRYDYIHMPSGTGGNSKAKIMIGAGATLNIVRVQKEIYDLKLDPSRLIIDPHAIVIEQSDRDYEAVLEKRIGSTKKGVGTATARKIVVPAVPSMCNDPSLVAIAAPEYAARTDA